jgi:hypothetical protein
VTPEDVVIIIMIVFSSYVGWAAIREVNELPENLGKLLYILKRRK